MGIAVESSKLWGPPPPSPANSAYTSSESDTGIAVREVLRCRQCLLVQFRTASDLCRRCAKPLPSHPAEHVAAVLDEDATPVALESQSAINSPMPLDRGARNRRLTVGSKLGAIRKERALTQVEMAELLGIPRSYLSRIENNRLLPGPLMVAKFAQALDLGISELLDASRHDRSGRLPGDPITASLLRHFTTLQLPQQADVLLRVRRMLDLCISPRPATVAPLAKPQSPEPAQPESLREPSAPVRRLRAQSTVAAARVRTNRSARHRFPSRARKTSQGRLTRAAR